MIYKYEFILKVRENAIKVAWESLKIFEDKKSFFFLSVWPWLSLSSYWKYDNRIYSWPNTMILSSA